MSSLIPVIRSTFNNDLDNIIDSFFKYSPATWTKPQLSTSKLNKVPQANISKIDGGYAIEMAAPGFSRDDFSIEVEDCTLVISMENSSSDMQSGNYVTREYSYDSFTRSWTLPEGVDSSSISARYDAGILTVNIPVENKASSKFRIDVS